MRYRFLRFPGGKPKAVTFSYDDSPKYDKQLAEIFDKYGMKGTFNINGSTIHTPGSTLTQEEVKEFILEKGHEVAVHGLLHRAEGSIRPISGIREVVDCRLELEKTYGLIIRGMAYPDTGITKTPDCTTSYETIKGYLKDLDIAYSRTLAGDNNKFLLPDDWYAWMPTCHHNNPKVLEYIDEFVGIDYNGPKMYSAHRHSRLFYVWGHSYEFNNNNNWDHIENICQKLGGKDDTWYATNIEIHDYVESYKLLQYSADETIVHNPTATKIWFEVDSKPYQIKPGETIKVEE